MPTYEFRCPDGTIVERVFKMSEVPETIPTPNGDGVATRVISGGAGLLFKGTGFYITDYGKDGKKDQRAAESKGSESKGEGKGASKSEGAKSSDSGSASATSSPAPAPSSSTSSSSASSSGGSGTSKSAD